MFGSVRFGFENEPNVRFGFETERSVVFDCQCSILCSVSENCPSGARCPLKNNMIPMVEATDILILLMLFMMYMILMMFMMLSVIIIFLMVLSSTHKCHSIAYVM